MLIYLFAVDEIFERLPLSLNFSETVRSNRGISYVLLLLNLIMLIDISQIETENTNKMRKHEFHYQS